MVVHYGHHDQSSHNARVTIFCQVHLRNGRVCIVPDRMPYGTLIMIARPQSQESITRVLVDQAERAIEPKQSCQVHSQTQ